MKTGKAAATVAAMTAATIISKLLGMVRQIMLARRLGDGVYAVAFAAASKIPLSVFDMLFSAAILGCFIPFYGKALTQSKDKADRLSSAFFSVTLTASAIIAAIGVIFSKQLVFLCAPSISAEASALASELLKIMFPLVIFAGAAYVLVGVLQSHGSFILPSLVSSVSNAAIIIYLSISGDISNRKSIMTLAAIYVLSWAVQFLTLAVPLIAKKRFPTPVVRLRGSGISEPVKMAPAVMIGAWFSPAASLLTMFFSSFVSDSAVAAFEYSVSLWLILAGVLTYGVCNFIFPSLSRLSGEGNEFRFSAALKKGVCAALLLSLPVAAGMYFLSENLICMLYLHGNFGKELALSCAQILEILSFAVPALCINETLSRAFYSKRKPLAPMVSSLSGIAAFMLCGAVTTFALKAGIAGIAVSYVAGQYTCAAVLLIRSAVSFPDFFSRQTLGFAAFALISASLSAAVMAFARGFFKNSAENLSSPENLFVCAIVFSAGCVVYLICILLAKLFWRGKNRQAE